MVFRNNDINTADLPSALDVNYADAAEICGYQLLLCKIFEKAEGFSYRRVGTNSAIRYVQKEGQIWLKEVRRLIASIFDAPVDASCEKTAPRLGNMPELLSSYDLLHRVCNGSTCYDYLRQLKLKTAMRWLRGDRSISKTDVTLLLLQEVNRDNMTLERRYSDFSIGVMGTWIDELTIYGCFRDTPYPEALKRLSFLLDKDLFAFLGNMKQRQMKEEWTNSYTVDDFTALDTPTLLEYIGFILTATRNGLYPCESDDELYIQLWTEYANRPNVNRFARAASAIDLELRQAILV